ncbi:hypothetical protein K503DRAFT_864359 [Rhizopogon vinicolor AM-OR11-026]|uniref:SAP domain-containing protein n=1 Tax=Rhizopogon vinicolor AM-OR11-026 TaxID=1314800 RepID=A0A1B7N7B3_9AGAM|nr:hypothetical protein K503DRAFT_864359 [Rhizopogon vinicolor AM-OR11-026]
MNLTCLDTLNTSSSLLFPSSSLTASQSNVPTFIPDSGSLLGDLSPIDIFAFIAIIVIASSIVTFPGWRWYISVTSFCSCFPCIVFYPDNDGTPSFVNMDIHRNPASVTARPVSNQDNDDMFWSADASNHDRMRLSKAGNDDQSFPFPLRFGWDGEPKIQHLPINNMSVALLKQHCRDFSLIQVGKKAELRE